MMCQSVAVSVSTINTLTVTTSSAGNPVASGTSQWRGRSPGDSDTSGTIRNAIVVASKVASSVSEFRCRFSCPYNSQSLLLSGHYCDGNCTPTAVIASGEGQLSTDSSLCLLRLNGSGSGQQFLCGPQYSGECW